jgi:serine/threonine-protein kinase
MDRLTEALEGRYSIERQLGEGGMATVYLAEDLKHKRKVAIKVLRPELAAVIGGERFLAEIQTTANLQHPHILPLFDSGESNGFLYYVMPFIDGETLRGKLDREKQLGVDEAVRIASDVADALDYAHRNGVIHRDIKPANILLHDGRPVVADFGIAVAVSAAGGGRMTETGLSLGTPHYMSPEQASADRDLSARSDVYSLGCVLYEMIAGQPPHTGPSAQSVLVRIMTEAPRALTEVRHTVPPHVAAVVAKAVEKLPADRFESAREFKDALGDESFSHSARPSTGGTASGAAAVPPPAGPAARRSPGALLPWALALGAVLLAVWGWGRPAPAEAPLTMIRMALPDSQTQVQQTNPAMDLAPDGRRFVYVGPGGSGGMLWYRELDQLDARPLRGTEGARTPVFAPDGQSVAFVTGAPGDLKVVGLDGDAPVTVLQDSAYTYGMTWADDGWIYITDDVKVLRIRAQGGSMSVAVDADTARAELWRGWPHAVPGGRYLLFAVSRGSVDEAEVGIKDMDTGESAILTPGLFPRYAPTGHLVFIRSDGTLMAAALDLEGLAITEEPAAVLGGISVNVGETFAEMDLSESGTLLYRSGQAASQELVWVDRDGNADPVDSEFVGGFQGISLSAAGDRVTAAVTVQGTQSIYVKSLAGGPWRRVTFETTLNTRPTWVPGEDRVAYLSNQSQAGAAGQDIWFTSADGSGNAESQVDLDTRIQEVTFSPDGRWVVFRTGPLGEDGRDILAIDRTGSGEPLELAATDFDEHSPAISPDGRWLAYVSDESGRSEVFVRPFPEVDRGKWQVSETGGTEPVWGRTGSELFFRSQNGSMMAASYEGDPSFAVVNRQELFSALGFGADPVHASYDISPDDQRFLMARTRGASGDLILVQNWFGEMLRRLGEEN